MQQQTATNAQSQRPELMVCNNTLFCSQFCTLPRLSRRHLTLQSMFTAEKHCSSVRNDKGWPRYLYTIRNWYK